MWKVESINIVDLEIKRRCSHQYLKQIFTIIKTDTDELCALETLEKRTCTQKSLLHRIWGWKGSLENQYCNSLGLKSGSSTTDCPGSYLMRSPRTETPTSLGNLLQCSSALRLRFSLHLNANSYILFHAHRLLSCDWAKLGRCRFPLLSLPHPYTLVRPSRLNHLSCLISFYNRCLKSFIIFATLY